MNFSELYKNNRASVVRAMKSMWCGEPNNDSQESYFAQMNTLISELFAPKDAIPVVQCMNSYKPVFSVSPTEAEALVGQLWKKVLPKDKYFAPYEHQYLSWKTLLHDKTEDGKPKSIVVTTGTGSGKTECFMLPLVHDLEEYKLPEDDVRRTLFSDTDPMFNPNQIQAIFLYPLNALMEDQKERLEQLLKDTNLTYTVYNGDLPEDEPRNTDKSDDALRLRRRIELITGGKYIEIPPDPTKGETLTTYKLTDIKFKKMLYTRKQVRKTPPNIMLTNPTMLEYILLRGADAALINKEAKSLRWVAIDETHTYTGAGAAELAMLLRRVLLAFNVDAPDVRFATSSATFGNAKTPEEKKAEEDKLRSFIAGITGLQKKQVEVIDGERVGEDCIPEGEDSERWRTIFNSDFIELSKLYPGEESVEKKLQLLDEMCEREEIRYKAAGKDAPDMKLKVHYFYRVPNNGLFVNLNEHQNGSFKIYTQNQTSNNEGTDNAPLLELSRCKHCGEYVALGLVNTKDWTYQALETDDSDMFDLPDDNDEEAETKYFIFGLSKDSNQRGDNNVKLRINKGRLETVKPGELRPDEWHLVGNTQCSCPYCNTKQTKRHETEKDVEGDAMGNMDDNRLQKFRLSAEFISRKLAPSILDQLDKQELEDGKIMLHDGQQYISFVDSRQAAAKATLKQNLEQERLWFYTTIYHELCRRKAESAKYEVEAARLKRIRDSYDDDTDEWEEAHKAWKKVRSKLNNHITWMEIADLIFKNKYCPIFCSLFIKRSGDSEEVDKDGNIPEDVMKQYVQSIMVMYLSTRPASAAAPETLGLFHTCYPQLKKLQLPQEVERFNDLMDNPINCIDKEDWRSLIQVFMDYTVRSNQSVFLRIPGNDNLDIFRCVRFATEKPRRRPVMKPKLEQGKVSTSRVVRYLCGLIMRDDSTMTFKDAQTNCFHEIEGVVNALWETLNNPENKLLEESVYLDETNAWHADRDDARRLNLINLSFQLFEDVYLCDATNDGEERHTKCLRPIENNFKRFSPYLAAGKPVELNEDLHDKWLPYPYYTGNERQEVTKEILYQWAKKERGLLWNNHIWGENGVFSDHLDNIHLVPNLFIQAEHTAQVDKDVARELQGDFKNHAINILACSTTMEMGVDLGNLEVVMLSSVPPMPANYKQRAGRSGRNNKVRSACITLCGSDAIGLRTLYTPIEKIISRPVHVPSVDLQSPQVVQRHVDSFLVRAFGVFTDGVHGGSLKQKVVDYYTTFHIDSVGGHLTVFDMNNSTVSPDQKLGEETGTMYERFNDYCSKPLSKELRVELTQLLRDTVYDGKVNDAVNNAYENNRRCYAELSSKLEDYSEALKNATNKKFRNKLYLLYLEVLNTKLLNYWATSRFTPNANMPVNVLSLDLNTTGKRDYFTNATSSNPSYSLREAIAQYAPGNTIVVDGVVYIVRGIETSSLYQDSKPFKKIYHDQNKTVFDDSTAIANKIPWPVNDDVALDLIQPAGFLPDINEDMTRIIDSNVFTHVSAQLIDTDDWTSGPSDPHLISVRSNKESGNAKILYYNEGKGYGYCFCPRCGRMVLEDEVADKDNPMKFPVDMNPMSSKQSDRPRYHFAISGKDVRKPCGGSSNLDVIKRNVIIGDLLQTDFSEIRIRHKSMTNRWISNRDDELNLLFTLGIVFSQALVDILGKERGAVDFAIMPNGHICIFDTNPGGAGYSNQISKILIMKDVISAAEDLLKQAKERQSKDMLLDKFTLRYVKYLDIDAALDWIAEENEAWTVIPESIKKAFPSGAVQKTLLDLRKAFADSKQEPILFVDDQYQNWDYNDSENGWRNQLLNHFIVRGVDTVLFCVSKTDEAIMREPIKAMLRSVKEWTKDVVIQQNPLKEYGLYPLAYLDGELYFTNNREIAVLNEQWGNSVIFCTRTNYDKTNMSTIQCDFSETAKDIKLLSSMEPITSATLGDVIQSNASSIINNFIEYCQKSESDIKVSYQDEHLKSIFGMIVTLQTIEHFVKQIGKDFSLEFKVEKYDDYHAKMGIQANLYSSAVRNQKLTDFTTQWAQKIKEDHHLRCTLIPIVSLEHNTLTHWRELAFTCGDKTLSIYPDGGFANGWSLTVKGNTKRYTPDNTNVTEAMPMRLKQDIRIEVAVDETVNQ